MAHALEVLGLAEAAGPLADVAEAALRGPLAAGGLDVRVGQVEMARMVADHLDRPPAVAAIEAPTGSGKGLGYLVPGVLAVVRARARGRPHARLVVSTAGIPLQRQLVDRDLPALGAALGIEVSAAVVKGRSNYLCPDALQLASVGRHADVARRAREWLDAGGSGDREDMPWEPSPAEWAQLSVGHDGCLGESCRWRMSCPTDLARGAARKCAVVVVNHHYLALARSSSLLKDAVGVVLDEAHGWERAARRATEVALSARGGAAVGAAVGRALSDPGLDVEVRRQVELLIGMARPGRLEPGWAGEVPDRLAEVLRVAEERCEAQDLDEDPRAARAIRALRGVVGRARAMADARVDGATPSTAWAVDTPHGLELRMAEVGPMPLPSPGVPVVVTSATLAGGSEEDLREAVGRAAPGQAVVSRVLPHPWPVATMGLAVVPRAGDPIAQVRDLAIAVGGGVLALASSRRGMSDLAHALRLAGMRVRQQGDAGRSELVEWFRRDEDGCLVGTRSLWEGVDVPGRACRAVVIDRVPFAVPDELEVGICEAVRAGGHDPFRVRSLPDAIVALRQGVGRLLRTSTDRGVVLVLDRRIWTARWGAAVRRALEPMQVSDRLDDVAAWMSGGQVRGVRRVAALRRAC